MYLDAHQHFWTYDPVAYDWIDESMKVIQRDFLPPELAHEQGRLGFSGSVAVQARQSLKENDFLLGLADQYEEVKGVVGWVDLCSEEVDLQLQTYAPHAKFVGVRHIVQAEPDDQFMLRPDFQRGIGKLSAHGLTYDILTFPRQLPAAIELVKAFPNQPFVLDHLSKPFIKDGRLSPWDTHIRSLAAHENVYCKLSGMVTEADWSHWQPTDLRPYLDVVLEAFGAQRLMIGSDWPVCLVAGHYQEVIGVVTQYLQSLSEAEQTAILGTNCQAFYGL